MRQYLPVVWILGSIAACSGASEGDGGNDGNGVPMAGTSSQATAGTPAAQPGVGGSATGGSGTVTGTGGSSSAGSGTTAGGPSTAGSAAGGAAPGAAGAASAGAGGGPGKKMPPALKFPTPVGADTKLGSSKEVTDFDGKGGRFVGTGDLGGTGQGEGQDPLFVVKAGGTLKNVILGSPAADGIHCEGSCTIDNVWWEDVGEDAITLLGGSSSNVYRISNSGAKNATDKVIQHNGAGTLYVKNFLVETFGKLYRSCGNCDDQYARHVEFDTIVANGSKSTLAGVNTKYKDTAKFVNIFPDLTMTICERYDGNNTGDEPVSLGKGADGTYCIYAPTDITTH
jgi:pectate lyase